STWDGLDDVTRRILEALPTTGGAAPSEVAVSAGVAPNTARAVLGRRLSTGAAVRGPGGWRRAGDGGVQMSLSVAWPGGRGPGRGQVSGAVGAPPCTRPSAG